MTEHQLKQTIEAAKRTLKLLNERRDEYLRKYEETQDDLYLHLFKIETDFYIAVQDKLTEAEYELNDQAAVNTLITEGNFCPGLIDDIKKYLGLNPYNKPNNISYADIFFYNAICKKYGKDAVDTAIKVLQNTQ